MNIVFYKEFSILRFKKKIKFQKYIHLRWVFLIYLLSKDNEVYFKLMFHDVWFCFSILKICNITWQNYVNNFTKRNRYLCTILEHIVNIFDCSIIIYNIIKVFLNGYCYTVITSNLITLINCNITVWCKYYSEVENQMPFYPPAVLSNSNLSKEVKTFFYYNKSGRQ